MSAVLLNQYGFLKETVWSDVDCFGSNAADSAVTDTILSVTKRANSKYMQTGRMPLDKESCQKPDFLWQPICDLSNCHQKGVSDCGK